MIRNISMTGFTEKLDSGDIYDFRGNFSRNSTLLYLEQNLVLHIKNLLTDMHMPSTFVQKLA